MKLMVLLKLRKKSQKFIWWKNQWSKTLKASKAMGKKRLNKSKVWSTKWSLIKPLSFQLLNLKNPPKPWNQFNYYLLIKVPQTLNVVLPKRNWKRSNQKKPRLKRLRLESWKDETRLKWELLRLLKILRVWIMILKNWERKLKNVRVLVQPRIRSLLSTRPSTIESSVITVRRKLLERDLFVWNVKISICAKNASN